VSNCQSTAYKLQKAQIKTEKITRLNLIW